MRFLRTLSAVLSLFLPVPAMAALHLVSGADYLQAPVASAFTISNASTGNNGVGWHRCIMLRSTASPTIPPVVFSSGNNSLTSLNNTTLYVPGTGNTTLGAYIESSTGGVWPGTGSDYSWNLTDGVWRVICVQAEPDLAAAGASYVRVASMRMYTATIGEGARLSGGVITAIISPITSTTGLRFGALLGPTTTTALATSSSINLPLLSLTSLAVGSGVQSQSGLPQSSITAVNTIVTSGISAAANPGVITLANTNGVQVGQALPASSYYAATTITAINGNAITLGVAATQVNSGVTLPGGSVTLSNAATVANGTSVSFSIDGLIADIAQSWGGECDLTTAEIGAIAQGATPASQSPCALDYNYSLGLTANSQTAGNSVTNGATVADLSANNNAATLASAAATWVADPVFPTNQIGITEPPPVTAIGPSGTNPIKVSGTYTGTLSSVDAQVEYRGISKGTIGVTPAGSYWVSVSNTTGVVPGMNAWPVVASSAAASTWYASTPQTITSIVNPTTTTSPSGAALTATTLTVPASVVGSLSTNQFFAVGSNYYRVTAINTATTTLTFTPAIATTALASNGAVTFYGLFNLNAPTTAATTAFASFPVSGGSIANPIATTATAAGGNIVNIPNNYALNSGADFNIPGITPSDCYVSAVTTTTATLLLKSNGAACNLVGSGVAVGQRLDFGAGQAVVPWQTLASQTVSGGTWTGTILNVPAGTPYLVRVRNTASTGVLALTQQNIGVGYIVVTAGQSLEYNLTVAGYYYTPTLSTYAQFISYNNQSGYCNGQNVGAGTIAMANMFAAALPYTPVQIIPTAIGGTNLTYLASHGTILTSGTGNTVGSTTLTVAGTSYNNAFGEALNFNPGGTPGPSGFIYPLEASSYFLPGTYVTGTSPNFTLSPAIQSTIPNNTPIGVNVGYWADTTQPNNLYQISKRAIQLCGNDVSGIIWSQGENETIAGITAGSWMSQLVGVAARYQSDFGRTAATMPFLIEVTGPDYSGSDTFTSLVRQDQAAYGASSTSPRLLSTQELYHAINNAWVHTVQGDYTAQQGQWQAQAMVQALTGAAIPSPLGPKLERMQLASPTVLRIFARMNGGTSLGVYDSPVNGIQAIPDGFSITDNSGTDAISGYSLTPDWIDLYLSRPLVSIPTLKYLQSAVISNGGITSLATNPFNVTINSNVITMTWPSHGMQVGWHFNLDNTAVVAFQIAGLSTTVSTYIPGAFTVASVIDANTITFNLPSTYVSAVTSTANGGANWRVRTMHYLNDNSVPAYGQIDPVATVDPNAAGRGPAPTILTPARAPHRRAA